MAWDISQATYDSLSFSVSSRDNTPRTVAISTDGTKMYALGFANKRVYQHTLSTAWDISSAVYDLKSLLVSGAEFSPQSLRFRPDGTSLYVTGSSDDVVAQYNLSTAWDVSTGTLAGTLDANAPSSTSVGLYIKPDGTKLYLLDQSDGHVYQYSLSTAWDITSASYDSVLFNASSQLSAASDLFMKSDGTKMYISDFINGDIYQYTLSTPWVISSAGYDSIAFDTSTQEGEPQDAFFKPDGTKMYVIGTGTDTVFQYSMPADLVAENSPFFASNF